MDQERDLLSNRRAKMEKWLALAGSYQNDFRRQHTARDLHDTYADADKQRLQEMQVDTAIAGRVMLRRVMGKASFITVQDTSGRIQCYLSKGTLGDDVYAQFNDLWDIGDIVGVRGVLMRTNQGELSVQAQEVVLLNKTLRPLPEKFHGVTDQETRYRQRYLDLMMNEDSRRLFRTRSRIISRMREFFDDRDYLEVETPMMHSIPGGATARP